MQLCGVCGELATSIVTGIQWEPLLSELRDAAGKRFPDVGPLEVRATSTSDHDRRLVLHKPWSPEFINGDPPERPYVLVTGEAPDDLAVRGYIKGALGQDEEWWWDPGNGRPAYFVPHGEMRPLARLMVWYHRQQWERWSSACV